MSELNGNFSYLSKVHVFITCRGSMAVAAVRTVPVRMVVPVTM